MGPLFAAHARLATCRTANGDIPWTAIDTFAQRYEIDDVEFLEDCIYGFERVLRAVEKMRAEPTEQDSGQQSLH